MKIRAFLLSLLLLANFVAVAAFGQQYSGQQFKASDSFLANGAHIDAADAGNIASASTVNICAMAGNSATITGTTTITAFDTCQAGIARTLRFAGAVTLTYNGTSLIIPAATNHTTAAGDVFTFISMGSGHWYVSHYALASGQAITGASVAGSSGDFQKNNGTGGLGAYTPTQATAALSAMVGDSGSGGTKGLAPAPAAGDAAASKFLSAAGNWAVPSGSGAGNVNGPVSSVAHDCAAFADTSGELLEDAGAACGSGGSSWTLISCQTASSSSSLSWTSIGSYKEYELRVFAIVASSNGASFRMQFGTGGGPTYVTSGYRWVEYGAVIPFTSLGGGSSASDSAITFVNGGLTTNTSSGYTAVIEIEHLQDSSQNKVARAMLGTYFIDSGSGGSIVSGQDAGGLDATTVVTAVKVFPSAGNFASGEGCLWGLAGE